MRVADPTTVSDTSIRAARLPPQGLLRQPADDKDVESCWTCSRVDHVDELAQSVHAQSLLRASPYGELDALAELRGARLLPDPKHLVLTEVEDIWCEAGADARRLAHVGIDRDLREGRAGRPGLLAHHSFTFISLMPLT